MHASNEGINLLILGGCAYHWPQEWETLCSGLWCNFFSFKGSRLPLATAAESCNIRKQQVSSGYVKHSFAWAVVIQLGCLLHIQPNGTQHLVQTTKPVCACWTKESQEGRTPNAKNALHIQQLLKEYSSWLNKVTHETQSLAESQKHLRLKKWVWNAAHVPCAPEIEIHDLCLWWWLIASTSTLVAKRF